MTAEVFHPPKLSAGRWVRENLFNNWYNSALTLVLGGVIVWAAWSLLRGLVGIDVTILRKNLTLFMVGQFGSRTGGEFWRPWASGISLALGVSLAAGLISSGAERRALQAGLPFMRSRPREALRRLAPVLILIVIILALTETITPTLMMLAVAAAAVAGYFLGRKTPLKLRKPMWLLMLLLLAGGYLFLSAGPGGVGWDGWGGLHLNVFLTISGIAFAFPLGMLLALGRRSSLPAVRYLSVTYIEVLRGVPLITVLIAGSTALGFLLPEGLRPSMVTRMLIAITAFQAAYIAEVVRGGLQALPRGQVEAGHALGLPAWKTMRLIVLPQALRHTIPPMVGQFIALFKDTTLVSIVGVLELLRIATVTAPNQPEFLGQGLFGLTLAFAALIFWVGSYTMSREARRLERKLGVGER